MTIVKKKEYKKFHDKRYKVLHKAASSPTREIREGNLHGDSYI